MNLKRICQKLNRPAYWLYTYPYIAENQLITETSKIGVCPIFSKTCCIVMTDHKKFMEVFISVSDIPLPKPLEFPKS